MLCGLNVCNGLSEFLCFGFGDVCEWEVEPGEKERSHRQAA